MRALDKVVDKIIKHNHGIKKHGMVAVKDVIYKVITRF